MLRYSFFFLHRARTYKQKGRFSSLSPLYIFLLFPLGVYSIERDIVKTCSVLCGTPRASRRCTLCVFKRCKQCQAQEGEYRVPLGYTYLFFYIYTIKIKVTYCFSLSCAVENLFLETLFSPISFLVFLFFTIFF